MLTFVYHHIACRAAQKKQIRGEWISFLFTAPLNRSLLVNYPRFRTSCFRALYLQIHHLSMLNLWNFVHVSFYSLGLYVQTLKCSYTCIYHREIRTMSKVLHEVEMVRDPNHLILNFLLWLISEDTYFVHQPNTMVIIRICIYMRILKRDL